MEPAAASGGRVHKKEKAPVSSGGWLTTGARLIGLFDGAGEPGVRGGLREGGF